MDCRQALEQLSPYLDDQLEPAAKADLEDHLNWCGKCLEELNALRACVHAVSSLERVPAPPGFLERVHSRIAEPSPWKRLLRKLLVPWHVKVPLHAAGALAMVLLIFLTYPAMRIQKQALKTQDRTEPRIQDAEGVPSAPPPLVQALPGGPPMPDEEAESPASAFRGPGKPIELVLIMEPPGARLPGATRQPVEGPKDKELLRERDTREKKKSSLDATPGMQPGQPAAPPPPTVVQEGMPAPSGSGRVMAPAGQRGEVAGKAKAADPQEKQALPKVRREGLPPLTSSQRDVPHRVTDEALSDVLKIIRDSDGTIVRAEHDEVSKTPASILFSIPAKNAHLLISRLRARGRLRDLPSNLENIQEERPIPITIRIFLVPEKKDSR